MSANRKYEAELVSEADYFVMAEKSEVRLEYIDGWVRAMAGTTKRHVNIASRVLFALTLRLRDGSCEVGASDLRLKPGEARRYYYPDILVYCENAEFDERAPDTLLSPVLVVEILSNSTQSIDRTEKLDAYLAIPSLRHYLLVDQNRVRVEHYHRNEQSQWIYDVYLWRRDEIHLDALQISVPVEEIYRRLDVPEGFVLTPED